MDDHAACHQLRQLIWIHQLDPDAKLFRELHAAFQTACDLEQVVLAQALLGMMEDVISQEELPSGIYPPGHQRLVDAQYRLLEVRYRLRTGHAPW